MGRKGRGAARDSRNAFDIGPTKNGSMWRESERRGDRRQLSRVIDRREIRPEISRSLSRFFPLLPSHSFQTFFLPLLRFEPRKGKERIGIIYIIALQYTEAACVYERFFEKGGIKKKGRWNEKRRGLVIMACSERSRHSRPYSARNKRRTSVSRERIELGMQQVKQPLLPPFYSNEIPFRRDFLKVSYFFTNYIYKEFCQNSLLVR